MAGAIPAAGQRIFAAEFRVMERGDHDDNSSYYTALNRAVSSSRDASHILPLVPASVPGW